MRGSALDELFVLEFFAHAFHKATRVFEFLDQPFALFFDIELQGGDKKQFFGTTDEGDSVCWLFVDELYFSYLSALLQQGDDPRDVQ